jgi:hypothetical protein
MEDDIKMEDTSTKIMQPKTIKSKDNNIFGNGRRSQFFLNGRRPQQKLGNQQ